MTSTEDRITALTQGNKDVSDACRRLHERDPRYLDVLEKLGLSKTEIYFVWVVLAGEDIKLAALVIEACNVGFAGLGATTIRQEMRGPGHTLLSLDDLEETLSEVNKIPQNRRLS